MKKNTRILSLLCFCFLFTASRFSVAAQEKKKMTPEELKQWNSEPIEENILAKIPAADKEKANDYARGILAYTLKAILHRADPAKYPVDGSERSPQAILLASVQKVSPATFTKMKERAIALSTDPAKRAIVLGKFKDIDFTKKSIDNDIQKITPIRSSGNPVMNTQDGTDLQAIPNNYPGQQYKAMNNAEDKNSFTKMDLVLRALHCVDETNPETPGDDDMIIGGLKVGCSGNSAAGISVVSCHFDDGDYCDHGAVPLGGYNLNACSGYPKTFYFILQLIEADSDERDAANALSDIMGIAADALQSTGYGEAIAYLASAVEVLSGWLFDDDAFHPYGIAITFANENAWGASGRSANKRTSNISDHGGTYRLGYYWQKRN